MRVEYQTVAQIHQFGIDGGKIVFSCKKFRQLFLRRLFKHRNGSNHLYIEIRNKKSDVFTVVCIAQNGT